MSIFIETFDTLIYNHIVLLLSTFISMWIPQFSWKGFCILTYLFLDYHAAIYYCHYVKSHRVKELHST